jgi:hypothetical protein
MPGPDFYIRQIGKSVWMYGEDMSDATWNPITNGPVVDNTVELSWADIPKGEASLSGTLMLNVTSDNELKVVNQTGGWGGEDWNKMSLVRNNPTFRTLRIRIQYFCCHRFSILD